jgi:hypothetical protein
MAEEKTFFQYEDVTVTNARFMVAKQTFAMSNITSVQASQKDPSRLGPIILLVIAGFCLMGGVWVGVLLLGGAGILWWVAEKPTYHVMLTTAGGESSALSSKQREYIEKVVQALNDAIVARG